MTRKARQPRRKASPARNEAERADLSGERARQIVRALLAWYDGNRRDLPWRRTSDPYAVWVSETMLQQTQVATVHGYYERWMERFPTVHALARADEDSVLHAWQGLGYYSRARNLWRGARAVIAEHGGQVPRAAEALRLLPGIGPYSAGAIASIAYGERAAVGDGNVVRVLCRLFGLRGDPSRTPLKSDLWRLAELLVPGERPGDFNQAMMELGATVCVPRAPKCDACPLHRACVARAQNAVHELPELPKRRAAVAVARAAAVVVRQGRILCVQAPETAARWAGMWQVPSADIAGGETAGVAASRAVREAVGIGVDAGERLLTVRHSVTHHRITLDVLRCNGARGKLRPIGCQAFAWRAPAQLATLAMPAAHRRIARFLLAAHRVATAGLIVALLSCFSACAGKPVSRIRGGEKQALDGAPKALDERRCGGIAIPMGSGARSGGAVGAWTSVTPASISLARSAFGNDNFGAQDVLVDPVRPSDLYAFVCHQGLWKSTDYGQTWTKINTGANGAAIDAGKPWSSGIDTNRCRDPATPPTLYTFQGAGGDNGFWRSTDGGVSWARHPLPEGTGGPRSQDGYSVDVDPYDGRHVIAGFHEETGYTESHDGGQTWKVIHLDLGMASGVSWYGFFIDTGDATTTAKIWLLVPQSQGGKVGAWRTADAGESWKRIESIEHPHGGCQIFQDQDAIYLAGDFGSSGPGVYRSTDRGVTWSHVGGVQPAAIVYGTPRYVYAQYAWANSDGVDQSGAARALQPGTAWSAWPLAMSNGPKHAAITYDGSHYVIVSGSWNAGIWRYVEP